MVEISLTKISSKGQVVIPNEIRENMHLEPGTKLIVIQDGDNILLKPIKIPKKKQFEKIIALGDKVREEIVLEEKDIEDAIKNVRKEKNAHRS